MTSPRGMDELLLGLEHEDVNDWVEQMTMAAKVKDFNANSCLRSQS